MTTEAYVFTVSHAQRSLWLLDQLAPGSALYNLHVGTRLSMRVDVPRLEWSINEIVRRHESLRTAFKAVGGEPVQVVMPALHVPLRVTDLGELTEPEREDEAFRIAMEEAGTPFDLATWPLLRTRLLRMGAEDQILLVTMHHIICDYWSLQVFQNELSTLYGAGPSQPPSPLPQLPVQYADVAEWERRWLQGPVGRSQLEYWKRQLADLPVLALPTDWPRPQVPSFEGAAHDFELPASLYAALVRLSQQENVTLFMTTLAAFDALLHRHTGQDDVVVGTPFANRDRAELEHLIGFFVNSLVLRVDLSGDPTFREALARVRSVALDAYAHRDLPFEKLVSELRPERGLGFNPLFQVHFQLLSGIEPQQQPGALAGEPLEAETSTAKFDLALDLWEYPDTLWGRLEYSTDLFSHQTVARLEGHFRSVLEAIVADPDRRLSELPLLSADERRQVLVDGNRTAVGRPRDVSLPHLFEAQVRRSPDAVALTFRQEQLTYEQLNSRANQLAHHLRSIGVGPESLVCICVERSLEMVIGLLGILKAGAAYLPLDPSDPAERLRLMLDDARPQVLLTQQRLAGAVPSVPRWRLCLDADWDQLGGASEANPPVHVDPRNLAYAMYTSGSTGKPKAVLVPSQAVCNNLLWMQAAFPLSGADRVLQKYPYTFDASVYEIFGPLVAGARLIVTEPSEHWDSEHFVRLLRDQAVTALDVVPSMLEALLEEAEFSACHSLRRVISGGEPLPAELRDRFFAQMDTELHNLYGPTEATITATSWTCLPEHTEATVPIGRPGANTRVYILDRHLQPVAIGVHGELCIGGDGLARGYLRDPGLTAERFVPDPFADAPGARMYRTGDLARHLPDGTIEYVGRMDAQVKVGGRRVELGEIESVLAQHESVRSCAVVAVEDEGGRGRPTAHVVPVQEQPELWPSLGEYGVYDELLYYAMTHDEHRNRAYRSAIDRAVGGRVVLDIGTGADAVLARFCVEAGAKQVYAVEVDQDAYDRAVALVERLGLADRIALIHGDSTQVRLPERVDVCVSEIVGTIGSSEGVVSTLNDARRFLKDGGTMIPRRSITRIAPVSLPENLAGSLHLTELPGTYVRKVFDKVGYPFDLRMCIKNFPPANLLSSPGVFEDLDFSGLVVPAQESEISFTISRAATLHGFLLWLNLHPGEDELLDSLNGGLSWLPVFFPVFHPGIAVAAGDVIEARCSRRPGEDGPLPDYAVEGVVTSKHGEPVAFAYAAARRTNAFKGNPFYESLFAGVDRRQPLADVSQLGRHARDGPAGGLVPALRRFLQDRLPRHMVPSSFVVVDALPRTPSGKLDRRALRAAVQGRSGLEAAYVAPRDPTEQTLAQVWAELLGVERVGVHDNFFELGGDSILSIQIIARANQAGLRLRPAQLFQHQTIAELAAVVGSAPLVRPDQGMLTGPVPLTPVQHWFFEQDFADPHHFNQSLLIELPSPVDAARLREALGHLEAHHDALRLRYTRTESGWQQAYSDATEGLTVARLHLAGLPEREREAVFASAAAELQASLDLSAGSLLRAASVDLGHSAPYLLLVIHHLVVDSVSWRILLEDLWTAYEQLARHQEVHLPAKTTSFQLWARRLAEYAQTAEVEREQAHWLGLRDTTAASLPVDHPGGVNSAASARTVAVALDVEETRALLEDLPKAFHTQINDVLLTALVQALARWTGEDAFLIEVEGHGREDIIEGVDLSRTVGWFTTMFPVHLALPSGGSSAEALRSIKEQLRMVPRRGIGYGALRYLSRDATVRARLKAPPEPQVTFNYLGQFGRGQAASASWRRLAGLTGPNVAPRAHRPGLLEVDGSVADGRLETVFTYSENLHLRATIETFAGHFDAALRRLLDECGVAGAGGFTPSDFSGARLTQKELDKLISKLQ